MEFTLQEDHLIDDQLYDELFGMPRNTIIEQFLEKLSTGEKLDLLINIHNLYGADKKDILQALKKGTFEDFVSRNY